MPTSELDERILDTVDHWPGSLAHYGLKISTGPSVAFRAKGQLTNVELVKQGDAVPLTHIHIMSPVDPRVLRQRADAMRPAIAAHRAALRERLARDAQTRWGGMSLYIQEEGATLPIEASPYQQGCLGPRANLMRTLHTAERLLVLGEPGAGKTVALERLAWELCDDAQSVIPVLISLRFYDGAPLLTWVRSALQKTGHLRFDDTEALVAFLQEGPARCVFLLDGLNEVPPAYRDTLVGSLVRWMDAYPKHALVLTSRVQDAESVILRGHEAAVHAVTFSLDGARLATGGEDNTVRLWRVSWEALLDVACRTVGRNLTREAWGQYLGAARYRETCAGAKHYSEWGKERIISGAAVSCHSALSCHSERM